MTEYERGFIDGVKSKVEAELTPTIIKMTDGLSQTIQEAIKTVIGNVKITANEPAADKHGYWVEEEPRVLKCSVCGEYAPMNYLGQNCIDSRYCPWCGTKMDSNAEEPWQSD